VAFAVLLPLTRAEVMLLEYLATRGDRRNEGIGGQLLDAVIRDLAGGDAPPLRIVLEVESAVVRTTRALLARTAHRVLRSSRGIRRGRCPGLPGAEYDRPRTAALFDHAASGAECGTAGWVVAGEVRLGHPRPGLRVRS
jgi:hypothetical protein